MGYKIDATYNMERTAGHDYAALLKSRGYMVVMQSVGACDYIVAQGANLFGKNETILIIAQ